MWQFPFKSHRICGLLYCLNVFRNSQKKLWGRHFQIDILRESSKTVMKTQLKFNFDTSLHESLNPRNQLESSEEDWINVHTNNSTSNLNSNINMQNIQNIQNIPNMQPMQNVNMNNAQFQPQFQPIQQQFSPSKSYEEIVKDVADSAKKSMHIHIHIHYIDTSHHQQ